MYITLSRSSGAIKFWAQTQASLSNLSRGPDIRMILFPDISQPQRILRLT